MNRGLNGDLLRLLERVQLLEQEEYQHLKVIFSVGSEIHTLVHILSILSESGVPYAILCGTPRDKDQLVFVGSSIFATTGV